ncbi:MAG: NAD-dependent epimerase/dehydratase family protein [Clostridiales bacterium]|nr:NAD-dependent epimerase/dehydratase family protein [Clostridiales bacterium]
MIYNSNLWLSDLDLSIASLPSLSRLNGKTVLVTGAGGLICSAVVDVLIRYNETQNGSIKILAAGRSEARMRTRFGEFFDRPYFEFVPYDASDSSLSITSAADYIIHGVGNATPARITGEPVETMTANFAGLLALLNYAGEVKSTRVLYISSSEVYGQKEGMEPFKESDYGYVDLLNPRSSYPVSKRAAETLCISYSLEYGVDTVIARPGHIYGPNANSYDNRVWAEWTKAAARGENIVMKSTGTQLRSYCYSLDCATAVISILLDGEKCRAYNISNPDAIISIRQMAEYICEAGGVDLVMDLPTDSEQKSYSAMSNASLDSTSLEGLGWKGLFDAPTGFGHTVDILREV